MAITKLKMLIKIRLLRLLSLSKLKMEDKESLDKVAVNMNFISSSSKKFKFDKKSDSTQSILDCV